MPTSEANGMTDAEALQRWRSWASRMVSRHGPLDEPTDDELRGDLTRVLTGAWASADAFVRIMGQRIDPAPERLAGERNRGFDGMRFLDDDSTPVGKREKE